jgi:hypothetical protein
MDSGKLYYGGVIYVHGDSAKVGVVQARTGEWVLQLHAALGEAAQERAWGGVGNRTLQLDERRDRA